ncbi:MAG: hypothetical protein JXQ26_03040, partial [Tissierellales bacterium]|nr:hypothetical protein [Tissierellales bacterium]
MKLYRYIIIIFSLIFSYETLFSYELTGRWLEKRNSSNPHILFLSTAMNNSINDSLSNEWIRFDIGDCFDSLHVNDSIPSLVQGSVNDVALPRLDYLDLADPDKYGNTSIPGQTGNVYSYSTFTISLNSNTRFPWYFAGGGSTGGVDINTIFRHELGHACIFEHDYLSDIYPEFLTLMSDAYYHKIHNYPRINFETQEIAGLSVIYQPPQFNANTNTVVIGDSIHFTAEGSICFPATGLSKFFNGYVSYPDVETYDINCLMPATEWEIDENINKWGADFYFKPDRLGTFKYKVYTAMKWNTTGDLQLYESNNRPYSEVSFKVIAAPTIESPLPNEIYHTRPSGGKGITDTLAIKVRVPEVLGSYPDINIKIDDVYVNPGDITFDSGENVWIYNWDLSTVSTTEYGKRFSIRAEIDGDPTDFDVTGIYLVEALFYEDFQVITDLTAAGWAVSSYEYPVQTYTGWYIGNDPTGSGDKCTKSLAYPNSTAMAYRLYSPAFTVPTGTDTTTKLQYRIYFNRSDPPNTYSLIKFYICDSGNVTLTPALELNQFTIDGYWIDLEYDLSSFAGQTIKLHWNHYYNSATPCVITTYALDDILVYSIPDMEGPNIDFVAGNTAEPNEDMNLNIGFNDNSGISSVTAD